MLNISNSDIKKSDIITDGDTICYDITLVRKPMTCPYCGGKMIGHGHKLRLIKHPAIRTTGIICYMIFCYINTLIKVFTKVSLYLLQANQSVLIFHHLSNLYSSWPLPSQSHALLCRKPRPVQYLPLCRLQIPLSS